MAEGMVPTEARGESMVQKHREKLQREKEAAMLAALKPLVPVPESALRLAAEEANWDLEPTVALLKLFQAACAAQLQQLVQAQAPSSSGSESEDSPRKRRRSKSKHKHKSRDKDSKRKRSKRAKQEPESLAVTDQFGKYGVIREADLYSKHAEFALWAADVRKVDIGLLPKLEEKELFKDFCEDFNTGTLPHRKYYDRDAYERQRAAKAAKKGAAAGNERTAFDDETEHRRELVAEREQQQEDRLREAYNQLKYVEMEKREDMREQDLLRQQMQLAYRIGDQDKANKIMDRLRTDEQKEKLTERMFEEGGAPPFGLP